jgi:hypothetical protein
MHDVPDFVVGPVQEFFQKRFAGMRKRSVPDIVEQCRSGNKRSFFIGKAELPADNICKVHRTQ